MGTNVLGMVFLTRRNKFNIKMLFRIFLIFDIDPFFNGESYTKTVLPNLMKNNLNLLTHTLFICFSVLKIIQQNVFQIFVIHIFR